jgi:uncharacterized protein YggU (UPF0235/DUF167 family)
VHISVSVKPGKAQTIFKADELLESEETTAENATNQSEPLTRPTTKEFKKSGKKKQKEGASHTDAQKAEQMSDRNSNTTVSRSKPHSLVVELAAQAREGEANQELCSSLAKLLKVPKRNVTLVSGGKSRQKVVGVVGIGVAEVQEKMGMEVWGSGG